MSYTQDFFTSRRNYSDGNTRIGELNRLWYDPITNTIRVGDGSTPGGIIVGGGTSTTTGVTSIIAGAGISINTSTGDVTITNSGAGSTGYTGSIGYTGSASTQLGYTGSIGYSGSIGYTGSRGLQGSTGTGGALAYAIAISDYNTQTVANITSASVVTFDTVDFSNGITLVDTTKVKVSSAGLYNFQWSAQFVNLDTQEHDVYIWVRINGVDVPGSTGRVAVVAKHGGVPGHTLPSWNFVFDLAANDFIELVWSTSSLDVSITPFAVTFDPTKPGTASVVVTLTQVMYTQIGYTGSTGPATTPLRFSYESTVEEVNNIVPSTGKFKIITSSSAITAITISPTNSLGQSVLTTLLAQDTVSGGVVYITADHSNQFLSFPYNIDDIYAPGAVYVRIDLPTPDGYYNFNSFSANTQTSVLIVPSGVTGYTGSNAANAVTNPYSSALSITNATVSTSTTTGALTVTGGVGVGGTINAYDIALTDGAWQTFNPSWTASVSNPSIGDGTITGRYRQVGKSVEIYIVVSMGSTTTFGSGNYRLSLPVSAKNAYGVILNAVLLRNTVSWYQSIAFSAYESNTSYVTIFYDTAPVTATVPATWQNGDSFVITGSYEAA